MKAWGVALAVLAVALPARASAPAAAPPDVTAERARLLSRLPSERVPLPGDDPNADHYAALAAAGDLDGDGGGDVVDFRYRVSYDATTGLPTESVRIEVFRGRDGAHLWTNQLAPAWLTIPFVTKVGPSGANGVVVVSYRGGSAATYDTTVTAYDARGARVWETSLTGVYGLPVPAHTRSVVDGLVDAVPGGGTDLVVTTPLAVGTGDTAVARTRVSVIDGATGALRQVGEPVADPYYGLRAVPVGDLDGDRVDDVALTDGEGGGRGAVTAFSLGRGVPLWSAEALPANDRWDVRGIADATGDGVRDVTVAAVTTGVTRRPAEVALVDGATGRILWRRPGDGAVAVGDVDGRRGSEVVVGLPGEARLTLTAYDARGAARWRLTRSLPAKEAIHTESQWYDGGDVGPDGVRDVRYRLVSRENDRERRDEGTVDGRTGRVRRDAVPGMVTSLLPIDGRGSDTFAARPGGTLTAYRGNGPGHLWSVVPNAGGAAYAATTLALDGDRCADVVVSFNEGGALTAHAFAGATGRPMWRLMRWHHEPGRVSRPAPIMHRQDVRTC